MTVGSEPTQPLRLIAIRYAAQDTNLYEFAAGDGRPLPAYEPGAHIDLHLPDGAMRQYSLARPYRADQGYLVGVKLDAKTRGGSKWLHEAARVGSMFEVGGPRNNFPLQEDAPHTVLIAGGIGITPIWCMAQKLEEIGASFDLHYAVRDRADAAFLAELERLAPRVKLHVDVEAEAVLDVTAIVAAAPEGAHLYCCGPAPMLEAFEAAAGGRPPGQVHVEYFSAPELEPLEGGFVVVLAKSGREFAVDPGSTILETLRAAGLSVTSSCEQGVCGACETRILEGVPDHRDLLLTPAEKASGKTMMICCSGSLSDRLVLDL
ncbi:MAG TPA: PDR/VanB family oxidoreductase [Caulobacteraceae bacterium]